MYELTDIEFQILQYAIEHEPIGISQLKDKFPSVSSLEYRVRQMATPQYQPIAGGKEAIPNSSYLLENYQLVKDGLYTRMEYLGTFYLTELGKKAVQDHIQRTKSARKELWLKNAWIPILVSLATNLVIDGTKWLLPQILEWLSHIH